MSELAAGTELAGYRIESLVGRGGMGVVHRAHDLALERPVALKVLAAELAADERFRDRFLRESRLAASLDHPSIVPVFDAGGYFTSNDPPPTDSTPACRRGNPPAWAR